MDPFLWVPFAVAVFTLIGYLARLLIRLHRLLSRFERAVPTLEKIVKTYPGKRLQRTMDDFERTIETQSQELMRLAGMLDRRHGDRRTECTDKP